jgi:hypothetical protein
VDLFEAGAEGASLRVAPAAISMKGYEDGLAAYETMTGLC